MMLKFLYVLLTVFFFSTVFAWDPSTKIAVLGIDSRVKGEDIDTTSFSEMIQNALVNRKAYIVVERAQLDKILDEQKLQSSGIAENDASRIGSIAGANKVIMGSLFKIDNEYQLLIKVIDTFSGTIEIYQEIKADNLGLITENIPSAVDKIIEKSRGENLEEVNKINEKVPVINPETGNPRKPGFFPIQFSFVRGLALVPESFTIIRVGLNIIDGYDKIIYGVQAGFINECSEINGTQCGFINMSEDEMIGVQVGFVNTAGNVKGVQIGFYNSAKTLDGIQIGFINTVKEGWIGFMPIMNIGF